MTEPLTKDKIRGSNVGPGWEYIFISDLKSALEEFERRIFESFKLSQKEFEVGDRVMAKITFERALGCMKEAFPAIYSKEDPRTTIIDPFPKRREK